MSLHNPVTNPDNPVHALAHRQVLPQFLTDTNPHTNALQSIYREDCSDALEKSEVVCSRSPRNPRMHSLLRRLVPGDSAIYQERVLWAPNASDA